MIRFFRPDAVDWGNAWPTEESINEYLADGWRLVTILPPDAMSPSPTFVLQNGERWCCRFQHSRYPRWYERLWRTVKYRLSF